MMYQITNNNRIILTRGDAVTLPLNIFYNTDNRLSNYNLIIGPYDKLLFAIMEPNQRFEEAICKKIFLYDDIDLIKGTLYIDLDSVDTEFLQPGDYYYSVKWLKKDSSKETDDHEGKIVTIVDKTSLRIID